MIRRVAILLAVGLAVLGLAAPAGTGTLAYNVKLEGEWHRVGCDAEGPLASCFTVDYEAAFWPGLGLVTVHEDVVQSGISDESLCEPQTRRETLVAPRGTIRFFAEGIDCPGTEALLGGYRAVVALARPVEGTGAYVGVTGPALAGTVNVRPDEDEVYTRFQGQLDVPALAFDTIPPVFVRTPPAVRIRARGPRIVRYAVPAATDLVDGPLAVRCTPASGARFRAGRTIVGCAANDSSGNVASVSFAVIVTGGPR